MIHWLAQWKFRCRYLSHCACQITWYHMSHLYYNHSLSFFVQQNWRENHQGCCRGSQCCCLFHHQFCADQIIRLKNICITNIFCRTCIMGKKLFAKCNSMELYWMQLHPDCTEGGLYVKKFPTRFPKLFVVYYNQHKQSI